MNEFAWIAWPFLGGVVGAVAGSFLATLALRWPAGRSVAHGRSRCDGCGAPVPWWHLAPIVSFVVLRGRCVRCGSPIDPRQPVMEVACLAIGAAAFWVRPDMVGAGGALFGWLLAVLALLDRDHFWLPDRLVATLALAGLATGLAGLAPSLVDRLIGGVAGWAALAFVAFAYRRTRGREGLGQGDAKLLGAIGLWLGWRMLPWIVLGASLLGIGWAVALRIAGREVRGSDALPLGTLLAAAAWVAWFAMHVDGG